MLLPRKIDYYTQVILGCLMVLSIPFLFLYGFLAGLLFLGCLQVVSAAFNTRTFIGNGFRQQVNVYWKWVCTILAVLFMWIPFSTSSYADDLQVFLWVDLAGSVVVAIYYLHIYGKLISHLMLKRELGGLLKSKH